MVERERYVPELKGLFAFLPHLLVIQWAPVMCGAWWQVLGVWGRNDRQGLCSQRALCCLEEDASFQTPMNVSETTKQPECKGWLSRGDFWMAWEVPLQSGYQSWDLSGKKELAIWTGLGRVFPAEGKLRAQCPRQEQSWCVLETEEMPAWPECRDGESGWHWGQRARSCGKS